MTPPDQRVVEVERRHRGRSPRGRRARRSRLGLRQERSTLAVNASSQSDLGGDVRRRSRSVAVVAERAGQEVDAEVEPEAGVEQVLDLLVRLVAGDLRVERRAPPAAGCAARAAGPARRRSPRRPAPGGPARRRGTCRRRCRGRRPRRCPGRRAALAQRRDVAGHADGRDHPADGVGLAHAGGFSSSSRCFCSATSKSATGHCGAIACRRLQQQLTDGQVAVPLPVRRHDVPRRHLGVGALERDLVGPAVVRPPRRARRCRRG